MFYLIGKLLIKNKAFILFPIFLIPGFTISPSIGCISVIGYFMQIISSYNDKYSAEYFIICTTDQKKYLYFKMYASFIFYICLTLILIHGIKLIVFDCFSFLDMIIQLSYSLLGYSILFALWLILGNFRFERIFNCLIMLLLVISFFPEYFQLLKYKYDFIANIILSGIFCYLGIRFKFLRDLD